MLKGFVAGRVYVFIDAANVFYAQRTLGWRIAYARFINYLRQECGPEVKCFIYLAYNEQNLGEKKFLDMLDLNGYILRTKPIKRIQIGSDGEKHKGSLDVEIAFEMVETAEHYDTAILVSGDSDFAPALDRIKQRGKRVLVVSTRGRVARELLDRAKFIDLRKLRNEIAQ